MSENRNTSPGHVSSGDIVERLRGLRFVHVPAASGLMEEAAAEIERLRNGAVESRETVRLAATERKAVAFAADHFGAFKNQAATLRKLLERLA